ncbi:MAG TPA: glycoside hydrolase family 2 protein [Acidothermaceae bacterium]|nr:glycoside hydrolase family 2 protein [Acidothermaceae bacterium]
MQVAAHSRWTVTAVGGDVPDRIVGVVVPATVPGCVHLDLLAAGLIPDPYLDENESAVAWVGRVDWRFETTIEWDGGGAEVDLVTLGLDTVARIELNGALVAETANMHRSYRFAVRDKLQVGQNVLAITFTAGLTAAECASELLGARPHVNAHPFNALRKMACSFGWDWGPDLVTAGIWRPIYLETWAQARIVAVRPLVEVDGADGVLHAHVDIQRARGFDGELRVAVDVAGSRVHARVPAGESAAIVDVTVPAVALWWPHGYGDQPMYPVTVALSSTDDDLELATWSGRVGFRTVELDTSPDEFGTRFAVVVNGVPVFARGVNWIPDDAFPVRVTRDRYAQRLTQARDANVNLIRVWGGGIYESDDFYDLCDELGLLVWQDFLFACAAYAEEEPLRSEVIAEAREVVTRLSPHPSLALWNGNNENIWGHEDWGWKEPLEGRSWGWGYYTEVLPAIVAELDPSRPYSPGTPYSFSAGKHPNDPAHGTMHIWDVWNELDYPAYRRYVPRFVAEFGFQGPPTWATLHRAVHDDPLTATSPGVLQHQKAEDGNGKLARGLDTHLPPPSTIDDWHWATSLNQARAVSFGVEHFRSWAPICMGTVVWQLNDTWPAVSWAAIDGDGRRKPLWYALRRSYRDKMLTLQPRDDGLTLIVVNDCAVPWRGEVTLSRRAADGVVLSSSSLPVDVVARCSVALAVPAEVAASGGGVGEFILAQCGSERAWWHTEEDVDAKLPASELTGRLEQTADGYHLTITAHTFVRDLALFVDRVAPDAVVDDMLVTLLPGESTVFAITTSAPMTLDQLTDPLVLRSANQLVAD